MESQEQEKQKWKLPKLTKIQSIVVIVAVCLVASLASYAAANVLLWNSPQTGSQTNTAPTSTPSPSPSPSPVPTTVTGSASTFFLPPGIVGESGASYASATAISSPITSAPTSPILTVTTSSGPTTLTISASNHVILASEYSVLSLNLVTHGTGVTVASLNLLSTSTLTYPLPTGGTYDFDYIVYYTPSVASAATITLAVAVA